MTELIISLSVIWSALLLLVPISGIGGFRHRNRGGTMAGMGGFATPEYSPIIGIVPMSYGQWLDSEFKEDLVGEGNGIDEDDYATWWDTCASDGENNDFTQAAWEELNPTLPWDDYF